MINLAYVLCADQQLDAAEETASRAIGLLPEKGKQFLVCQGHRILGGIYRSKGDTGKAIHHFEVTLRIASSLNSHAELFQVHFALATLFSGEDRFDDAQAHVERAKSHAIDNAYLLAWASQLQAWVWYDQHMFEEAKSELSRALGVFEKLGATNDAEHARGLLSWINRNA